MEIEFEGDFAASAETTSYGYFIVVSQVVKADVINLLLAQHVMIKGRVQSLLKQKIMEAQQRVRPLDAVLLRQNLSSELGECMTKHLMKVQDHLNRDSSEVVAYTAWKYRTLVAWGEASAARELSLEMRIPVHTVHNRLRIARDRGVLPSPGPGSRLGR